VAVLFLSAAVYMGITAQQESPTELQESLPVMADAEMTMQLLLTEEDFLGGIKELIRDLSDATGDTLPMLDRMMPTSDENFYRSAGGFQAVLGMILADQYGSVLIDFVDGLVGNLRELELVVYESADTEVADILNYYDEEFAENGWRRNFWAKDDGRPTLRLYSLSGSGRLQMSSMLIVQEQCCERPHNVIVLSARLR